MELVPIALIAGGIGLTAQSQLQAGEMEARAFKQKAAVEAEKAVAERQARGYQARMLRRQTQSLLSSQLAAYAKSGIVPTIGSARIIQRETARKGEEDAQLMEREGLLAYGRGMSQAGFERQMARAKKRAGQIGAFGTVLTEGYGLGRELNWWQQT